jgi:hypothetical protein
VVERFPGLLAREILDWPSVEIRAALIRRMGLGPFLRSLGAHPVGEDGRGRLYRIAVPGAEPLVIVEVENSTPEPDGSRKRYALRVPPGIRSAEEGVAWTFGMSQEEYRPLIET